MEPPLVKHEPIHHMNEDHHVAPIKNEPNQQIKTENIKQEINVKQEINEEDYTDSDYVESDYIDSDYIESDYIESDDSIHSNDINKTKQKKKKKKRNKQNKNKNKNKNENNSNKEEKARERKEQRNDNKIIKSIHKKKKLPNSGKKWTAVQDKKLLKWMRKNPKDYNNIIKITQFASTALGRTASAVSGRIAFLKKSMKDKQKLIEEQNNKIKNTKKNNMEKNDNKKNNKNKKNKAMINKMEQNEDAKRLNDILNKLHDGYCIQMNVIQSIRQKMKEEKYTNIDIKDCKKITGGMSMECLWDKLETVQDEINKIPSNLININKSTKKRYRNIMGTFQSNDLCSNTRPKKKRKLND